MIEQIVDGIIDEAVIPASSVVLGFSLAILSFVFAQDFRRDGKKIAVLLFFLAIEKLLNSFLLVEKNELYKSLLLGSLLLSFSYTVEMIIMNGNQIIKASNKKKTWR